MPIDADRSDSALAPIQAVRLHRAGRRGGAIVATQPFDTSTSPCRTDPAPFGAGAELAMRMTVTHNAACAIGTKIQAIASNEVKIEVPPLHGTLALRGRSGVTYRPAPEFTGDDFFAFTLRGHSPARDNMSFVRVSVAVK